MKFAIAIALGVSSLVAVTLASDKGGQRRTDGLIVHEWGTFTSVAGATGAAEYWTPFAGAPDLPCFVHELKAELKPGLPSRIRMETPVLYFYTNQRRNVSVHVDFPEGLITEWYPQASARNKPNIDWVGAGPTFWNGGIDWKNVEVLPGSHLTFPSSRFPSHYFEARETDAAPLRIGDEQEGMLFYRGLASFDVPLRVNVMPSGELEIRNTSSDAIPVAIVFENQDGRIGYRMVRNVHGSLTVQPLELKASASQVPQMLAVELEGLGLYKKEAQAMVATWHDSWFEEGMRVFYLMPQVMADRILPLTVSPQPNQTIRAFVGRIEVLSPAVRAEIESAAKSKDVAALAKFGRFLEPFAARVKIVDRSLLTRVEADLRLGSGSKSCVP